MYEDVGPEHEDMKEKRLGSKRLPGIICKIERDENLLFEEKHKRDFE